MGLWNYFTGKGKKQKTKRTPSREAASPEVSVVVDLATGANTPAKKGNTNALLSPEVADELNELEERSPEERSDSGDEGDDGYEGDEGDSDEELSEGEASRTEFQLQQSLAQFELFFTALKATLQEEDAIQGAAWFDIINAGLRKAILDKIQEPGAAQATQQSLQAWWTQIINGLVEQKFKEKKTSVIWKQYFNNSQKNTVGDLYALFDFLPLAVFKAAALEAQQEIQTQTLFTVRAAESARRSRLNLAEPLTGSRPVTLMSRRGDNEQDLLFRAILDETRRKYIGELGGSNVLRIDESTGDITVQCTKEYSYRVSKTLPGMPLQEDMAVAFYSPSARAAGDVASEDYADFLKNMCEDALRTAQEGQIFNIEFGTPAEQTMLRDQLRLAIAQHRRATPINVTIEVNGASEILATGGRKLATQQGVAHQPERRPPSRRELPPKSTLKKPSRNRDDELLAQAMAASLVEYEGGDPDNLELQRALSESMQQVTQTAEQQKRSQALNKTQEAVEKWVREAAPESYNFNTKVDDQMLDRYMKEIKRQKKAIFLNGLDVQHLTPISGTMHSCGANVMVHVLFDNWDKIQPEVREQIVGTFGKFYNWNPTVGKAAAPMTQQVPFLKMLYDTMSRKEQETIFSPILRQHMAYTLAHSQGHLESFMLNPNDVLQPALAEFNERSDQEKREEPLALLLQYAATIQTLEAVPVAQREATATAASYQAKHKFFALYYESFADPQYQIEADDFSLEGYAKLMGFNLDIYHMYAGALVRQTRQNDPGNTPGSTIDTIQVYNSGNHWSYVRKLTPSVPEEVDRLEHVMAAAKSARKNPWTDKRVMQAIKGVEQSDGTIVQEGFIQERFKDLMQKARAKSAKQHKDSAQAAPPPPQTAGSAATAPAAGVPASNTAQQQSVTTVESGSNSASKKNKKGKT